MDNNHFHPCLIIFLENHQFQPCSSHFTSFFSVINNHALSNSHRFPNRSSWLWPTPQTSTYPGSFRVMHEDAWEWLRVVEGWWLRIYACWLWMIIDRHWPSHIIHTDSHMHKLTLISCNLCPILPGSSVTKGHGSRSPKGCPGSKHLMGASHANTGTPTKTTCWIDSKGKSAGRHPLFSLTWGSCKFLSETTENSMWTNSQK